MLYSQTHDRIEKKKKRFFMCACSSTTRKFSYTKKKGKKRPFSIMLAYVKLICVRAKNNNKKKYIWINGGVV